MLLTWQAINVVDITGNVRMLLEWQASTPTKQFKSHCAPEAAAQAAPAQMTVKELKAALEEMQLNAKGNKTTLVARLQEAQAAAGIVLPFPSAEGGVAKACLMMSPKLGENDRGKYTKAHL